MSAIYRLGDGPIRVSFVMNTSPLLPLVISEITIVGRRFLLPITAIVFAAVLQAEEATIARLPFTTFAGTVDSGTADGANGAARFDFPYSVAVDKAGNLYVADSNNQTIRKITSAGVVSTLAGSAGVFGSSDGTGPDASFSSPQGVTVDSAGNVYVTDTNNQIVRKISPNGVVKTLAGNVGVTGSADGTGKEAEFDLPSGIAVDDAGNIYVADSNNQSIRKITPAGVVTTLAGAAGSPGSTDGSGSSARFSGPQGVAVDETGNVYVADTNNQTIRKISPTGLVTTLAGTAGVSGSTDGVGTVARFKYPFNLAVDGSGNVYVADVWNSTIRKITSAGLVSTIAGNTGNLGLSDGLGDAALFSGPRAVAVDREGNLYVADSGNNSIRKGIAAQATILVAPSGAVISFSINP